MIKNFYDKLDIMIPDVKCELNYTKDYELLIATMLSAQTTDKRVNIVTEELFKYSLEELSDMPLEKIESIIKSLGTYTKKAYYISEIAKKMINESNGIIIKDRDYLESMPGVGRKTVNVVFSYLFKEPLIAVDTHVLRTSKILYLVTDNTDPIKVEKEIYEKISVEKRNKLGTQLVLFGRYICKAKKPLCEDCLFYKECKNTK